MMAFAGVLRASRGEIEFAELVAIWRSAVDATHGFVSADDLDQIEAAMAPEYLPSVQLTVAEVDGRLVGFAGTAAHRLEMLFVENAFRGSGIGSALLEYVVREQSVTELDVNEQNLHAVAFYASRGFAVIGRSETDEAGYPYPLLHMRKQHNT
jgi:putative acetyltransferase